MIDYVSTEISAYADIDIPTFDEAYPIWKNGFVSGTQGHYRDNIGADIYHSWELRVTNSYISEDSDFYDIAEPRIYALCLRQYENNMFSVSDISSSIGVCYYVISKSAGSDINNEMYYLRLNTASIPLDITNPFTGSDSVILGSDIYWLYSLGGELMSSANILDSILSLSIGGYSLYSLIFGTGFLIYAAWIIVKFVIP